MRNILNISSKVAIAVLLSLHGAPAHAAGTAFYVGEELSGMNKICYYEYLGSKIAITIKAIELCPLSIKV